MLTRLRWRFGIAFLFVFVICFWGYSNIHRRAKYPTVQATVTEVGAERRTMAAYEFQGEAATYYLGKTRLQVGDTVPLHCKAGELGVVCFQETSRAKLAAVIVMQIVCGILAAVFFIPEIRARMRREPEAAGTP